VVVCESVAVGLFVGNALVQCCVLLRGMAPVRCCYERGWHQCAVVMRGG